MAKNQLKVDILGTSFVIQSEEKQEYLTALYDHLKKKLSETIQIRGASDPLKIAILTCLNIIDELFKERQRAERIKNAKVEELPPDRRIIEEEIDEVAARIMKKIDESIEGG
jgi:cell division protein ZapA (FtsZ GTPase activity inhibitor)